VIELDRKLVRYKKVNIFNQQDLTDTYSTLHPTAGTAFQVSAEHKPRFLYNLTDNTVV
jgi:hypothetical protein